MPARDPNDYNIRAVERALSILDAFSDERPTLSLTDLVAATGLHKATAFRLITTLANHGYLERLPDGQSYRLGRRLAVLGAQILRGMDVRREALSTMTEVVKAWQETCDLGVFDQGEVFVVEVVRSPQMFAPVSTVGARLPAHATASGKLLLAYLSPSDLAAALERPLRAYTPQTLTTRGRLDAELATIREQGYAVDNEEFEVGVRGVAAPIRDGNGVVVAALGVPGYVGRITPERTPALAETLVGAARAVSERLGWRG